MSISLRIMDDCERPFGFLRSPLSGKSSKVVGGTSNVDSTRCHDMRTWIMKYLKPLAIAPSVPEINSIGPRWYIGSTTNGLRNSKRFKVS
ncbi:hypothetical protein GOBAR_AA20169 [Gossypium barbadense]|uniref:Uncharacterized protein n=1 Tax=Gossypium barbadense TaxID=3634 RepID=A0A2P5XAX2_GOSBA|nr:hypothetical protein GOBAR_AA20169 [Gossypium barbadense]